MDTLYYFKNILAEMELELGYVTIARLKPFSVIFILLIIICSQFCLSHHYFCSIFNLPKVFCLDFYATEIILYKGDAITSMGINSFA